MSVTLPAAAVYPNAPPETPVPIHVASQCDDTVTNVQANAPLVVDAVNVAVPHFRITSLLELIAPPVPHCRVEANVAAPAWVSVKGVPCGEVKYSVDVTGLLPVPGCTYEHHP